MKNWRGPILAMLLFAVLMAYVNWGMSDETVEPNDEEFGEKRVTDVNYEDIRSVIVRWQDRPELRVDAEVTEEGEMKYQLMSPFERPTDQHHSELLYKVAARIWVTRLIAEEDEDTTVDPSEYGLDDPDGEIIMRLENGDEVRVLIGDQSPIFTDGEPDRYLQVEGENKVYLQPGIGLEFFITSPDKWRDPVLLRLRDKNMSEIVIETNGDRWALQAQDDHYGWALVEPIELQGSPTVVENFFRQFHSLRTEAFVEDEPTEEQLQTWGLDEPRFVFSFVAEEGVQTLSVGAPVADAEEQEKHYAQKGDEPYVYTIPTEVLATHGLNHFSEWIALRPFEVATVGQALALDAQWQTRDYELTLGDDGDWTGVFDGNDPIELPLRATQEGIRGVLNLNAIDARVREDGQTESEFLREVGLDDPTGHITLEYRDDRTDERRTLTLLIGSTENDRVHAKVEGYPAVLIFENLELVFERIGELEAAS